MSATYDEIGRLLNAIGASSQTTIYAYDRTDNLTQITDPRSNLYGYAYDSLNRLVQTTDQVQLPQWASRATAGQRHRLCRSTLDHHLLCAQWFRGCHRGSIARRRHFDLCDRSQGPCHPSQPTAAASSPTRPMTTQGDCSQSPILQPRPRTSPMLTTALQARPMGLEG